MASGLEATLTPTLDAVTAAASWHGLLLRGGFAVGADDGVPAVDGAPAKSLLLFGNAGSKMWKVFCESSEYRDRRPDPLNRWSARIGGAMAKKFSARALFPFGAADGKPQAPFMRWAKRAEALQNSRVMMLIHPDYGLWHAYRFALAFTAPVTTPPPATLTDICARCKTQACRPACPVNAFTDAGYDADACHRYLLDHPDSKCIRHGCQSRVACPEGAGYRYDAPHAEFHQRAFVAAMSAQKFSGDAHAD